MLPVTWLPEVEAEMKGRQHFRALITHTHWLKSGQDFRAICWWGGGGALKSKCHFTCATQVALESQAGCSKCSRHVYCLCNDFSGFQLLPFLLKSFEFSYRLLKNSHESLAWRMAKEISNSQCSAILFPTGKGLEASFRFKSFWFFWIYCCKSFLPAKVQSHKHIFSRQPDLNAKV